MENINRAAASPPTTIVKFVYPEAGTTVSRKCEGATYCQSQEGKGHNKGHNKA